MMAKSCHEVMGKEARKYFIGDSSLRLLKIGYEPNGSSHESRKSLYLILIFGPGLIGFARDQRHSLLPCSVFKTFPAANPVTECDSFFFLTNQIQMQSLPLFIRPHNVAQLQEHPPTLALVNPPVQEVLDPTFCNSTRTNLLGFKLVQLLFWLPHFHLSVSWFFCTFGENSACNKNAVT